MNIQEEQKFRDELIEIQSLKRRCEESKQRLIRCTRFDINGSHKEAILKEMERKDVLVNRLKCLLKGKTYNEWITFSKKLTRLNQKIKTAKNNIIKAEKEIKLLKF